MNTVIPNPLESVPRVACFMFLAAIVAWTPWSATDAAPPRGYFANATYVGPESGIEAHHFIPAVSPDQLTLYFCDTDRLGAVQISGNRGLEDIWVATRTDIDEPFSDVQSLGPDINTSNSEVLGSVSADGLTLYFSRWGSEGIDLYQATRASYDEQFANVSPLGPGVNTADEEAMPFVSSDGLTLVYEVAPAGQLLSSTADVDIWMATRESTAEQFGNARALAMNSTSADDWYPSLSSDGLTLFTSDWVWQGERPGSPGYYSTWVSTRDSAEDPFETPVLITDQWPDSQFNAANITNSFITQDWPERGSKLYWIDKRYPGIPYPDPRFFVLDIFQADWVPYLDGDYNEDGVVNIADYTVWRNHLGAPAGTLPNDVDGGTIGVAQYNTWMLNFGAAAWPAASTPFSSGVPEPTTLLLGCMALIVVGALFRRWRIVKRLPVLALLIAVLASTLGRADIYQWEYIDPLHPELGRQQSSTLAPDGSGLEAVPGSYLPNLDLTMAWLHNHDLQGASFDQTTLTNADLSHANLVNTRFVQATLTTAHLTNADLASADFYSADLTNADLTNANLMNAFFGNANLASTGFANALVQGAYFPSKLTASQLYSTASYQMGDLAGVYLSSDLSGWKLAGMNLSGAILSGSDFRDTDFSNAILSEAVMWLATERGFTAEQLYSTASYQTADLRGIELSGNDLRGWDFSGQDLSGANFGPGPIAIPEAQLENADFTDAAIREADFSRTDVSPQQIYSTMSYNNHDLMGVFLKENDLTGWDFAGQNLQIASFWGANLTDTNFAGADGRAATFFGVEGFSTADTSNFIHFDGHVEWLAVAAGELMQFRDLDPTLPHPHTPNGDPIGDIPILVEKAMSVDAGSTLRAVFKDDQWGSTITFEPGISVTLDGTLELLFDDEASPLSLVGTTYQLFDWTGVSPSGAFDAVAFHSGTRWDTSNFYTTGEVTLIGAVPEPTTLFVALLGLAGAVSCISRTQR